MANGDIQDNLADDYLTQFNLSLGVSAVRKIDQFSRIQELTYNGILNSLKNNFLGLNDWAEQINTYSQTNLILQGAYNAIKVLVKQNRNISEHIVNISGLGEVGDAFESIE